MSQLIQKPERKTKMVLWKWVKNKVKSLFEGAFIPEKCSKSSFWENQKKIVLLWRMYLFFNIFFGKLQYLVVEFHSSFWIQMFKVVEFPFDFWIFVNNISRLFFSFWWDENFEDISWKKNVKIEKKIKKWEAIKVLSPLHSGRRDNDKP